MLVRPIDSRRARRTSRVAGACEGYLAGSLVAWLRRPSIPGLCSSAYMHRVLLTEAGYLRALLSARPLCRESRVWVHLFDGFPAVGVKLRGGLVGRRPWGEH